MKSNNKNMQELGKYLYNHCLTVRRDNNGNALRYKANGYIVTTRIPVQNAQTYKQWGSSTKNKFYFTSLEALRKKFVKNGLFITDNNHVDKYYPPRYVRIIGHNIDIAMQDPWTSKWTNKWNKIGHWYIRHRKGDKKYRRFKSVLGLEQTLKHKWIYASKHKRIISLTEASLSSAKSSMASSASSKIDSYEESNSYAKIIRDTSLSMAKSSMASSISSSASSTINSYKQSASMSEANNDLHDSRIMDDLSKSASSAYDDVASYRNKADSAQSVATSATQSASQAVSANASDYVKDYNALSESDSIARNGIRSEADQNASEASSAKSNASKYQDKYQKYQRRAKNYRDYASSIYNKLEEAVVQNMKLYKCFQTVFKDDKHISKRYLKVYGDNVKLSQGVKSAVHIIHQLKPHYKTFKAPVSDKEIMKALRDMNIMYCNLGSLQQASTKVQARLLGAEFGSLMTGFVLNGRKPSQLQFLENVARVCMNKIDDIENDKK